MKNRYVILLFMGLFCLWSCQEPEVEPLATDANVVDLESPKSATPTNPWNWDGTSVDYMPTKPGDSPILVPWASQASREFTLEVANDHKKANGWELVYSTFSTTQTPQQYYFVLYNKYSGLLRMYFYTHSGNFITSSYLTHSLEFEGAHGPSSPLMNFSDQTVVDINQNSPFASAIEKAQVAPNTWYVLEHELAYDENLSGQNHLTAMVRWPVRSVNITEVTIDGTQQGTLKGNISIPGNNFSLTGTLSPSNNTVHEGTIKLTGDKDKSDLAGFKDAFFKGAEKALEKAGEGVVKNILGGIFGKNSNGSTDNTNLKFDTEINLKGSLNTSFLVTANALAIPGVDNTTINGYLPAYEEVPGVFYIANKPVINRETQLIRQYNQSGQQIPHITHYMYELDENSVNLDFNPEVLAIASIQNIRKEVLVTGIPGTVLDPAHENIGGSAHMTGPIVVIPHHTGIVVGTRISFDVVPNDGSPKVTITKTFKSNMTYTTKWYDPNSGPGDDIPIDGPGGGFD